MKKLKLQTTEFGTEKILTREQLKKIIGGDGSGSDGGGGWTAKCVATCGSGTITCYGYGGIGCSATDNRGCSGNDSNGHSYYLSC